MNKVLRRSVLAAALAALALPAHAAVIVPVNADPEGQGLNDPTPAAPVGGNPGTTVGEQRRIAYQFAADLWGSVLVSPAQIRVQASFAPLRCDATGTVLGSAGAGAIYILSGPNQPQTLYHGALADALVGFDIQNGTGVDVVSRFNASYGGTNPDGTPCAPGRGWYYGLDGNTPAGQINFLNVVMHEIAHGLGFSGFGNVSTGAPLAGFPDVYSQFAFDNTTQRGWYQLDNTGRRLATISGNVTWRGANVTAQAPLVLDERVGLRVNGAGSFEFGTAQFGPLATPANFSGTGVLVNDGTASPSLGCAASPAGAYAGRIAVVDRGGCAFEIKARFAQDAGAIGVVVVNNTSGTLTLAEDPSVEATIPAIVVSQADGATLKAALPGAALALGTTPGVLSGADNQGFVRLFAPNPVQPGSSFSHFDTSAAPNLLMEPAITATLAANLDVDLTPALFRDEGWTLATGTARIGGCDTGVPLVEAGGAIVGASVQAMDNVCLASTSNKGEYQSCIAGYKDRLEAAGLLVGNQGGKIASCAAKRFK